MINLVTTEQKAHLRTDYRHRIGIVVLFCIVCALAVLLLFLVLIYVTLLQQDQTIEKGETLNIPSQKDLEMELSKVRGELSYFATKERGYTPTVLFASFIGKEVLPKNIIITSFAFSDDRKGRTFTLSGNAKTRAALVSFLEALRGKKEVVSLDSPLSNLSKSVDIPFVINMTLAPYENS